jgi:Cu(I)/Ag(I) efflux system membrane fusion protein
VGTIDAHEGDIVAEGARILRVLDLSTLWAEAQVYTTQSEGIDEGASATVRFPDPGGKEIIGKISFINPEVNPAGRINLIRVVVPNSNHQLQSGMAAYVIIQNKQTQGLTVSPGAVIQNEHNNIVWVQTAHNAYKRVVVETGPGDGNSVEILSGLQAGDAVVTSGVYLLNSEYIFKHGNNSMHHHDAMTK